MPLSYTSVDRVKLQHPLIGSATNLSSQQIFTFAEDSEGQINARLAKQYTIPVTETGVPQLLESIATDITVYRLLALRFFTQERLKDSGWVDRFKEANDLLMEIAKGTISLVNSAGTLIETKASVSQVWSNTKDYVPTFSELPEVDSVIDPDKIDDLEGERGI